MNKRMQSALIQGFIFNVIIALGLLMFLALYIWPNLSEISEKKQELMDVTQEFESMNQKGLTFGEFKSLYKQHASSDDSYVNNILKVLDKEFYERNLDNITDKNYSEFLANKQQEISEKKTSEEFVNTQREIDIILPPYSGHDLGEETLSDYDFINYVEALLYSFNLQTDDNIGIGAVIPYTLTKEESSKDATSISTDNNIFYIPLQLQLTGQKKDVLDFLHYIENVGSILIEEGEVKIYSDSTIKKSFQGEKGGENYNIYEHQFSEIESITMRDYIDTSSEISSGDMIQFIKTTQGREKFTVEASFRFYVAGLPDYKAEKFIDETLEKHKQLKQDLAKTIAQNKKLGKQVESSDVLFAISSINSLGILVENMSDTTLSFKKTITKDRTKLGEVYEKSLEIDQQLDKAESIFKKHQKTINTIQQ